MPKRRKSYRWLWGIIFLILIAGTVTVAILVRNNLFGDDPKNNNSGNTSQDTPASKSDDRKEGDTKKPEENPENKKEDVPQYTGDNPNKASNLSGVISYADVVGENLVIRVNIDQFLSNGNCTLNIVKNGTSVFAQLVSIMESVSTSTCDGYNIPVSSLPKGDLQLEVLVESEGKSGKITGRVRI